MKKTLSFMVMAVALLLTQCRKPAVELPTAEPANENVVSMTVTVGHGGKTDINGATGAITWSAGDKLYVGDGTKYIGYLTLVGDGGDATGTFSGSVTADAGTYTFGFYYLGRKDYTSKLKAGKSTPVDIPFAAQTGLIGDLSDCHIGYGTATGRVDGTSVILESTAPVTMTSKVAIAYFEFKDGESPYTGAIILSGTNIYNGMTVKFSGAESDMFTGKTVGGISLASTPNSKKYVMLVPTGTGEETLKFVGGVYEGTTKLYKGIEANKFYCVGAGDPIAVSVTPWEPTWVDLGLSVKWATCNLGATSPGDYGNYYAWGETAGYGEAMVGDGASSGASYEPGTVKTNYGWAYYKWGSGTKNLGKYVDKEGYGMTPPDNKTTIELADDAARAVWGGDWRMPTMDEFTELYNNTTLTWCDKGNTEFNGVAGYKCVSKVGGYTDKYIFLPAAGYHTGTSFSMAGSYGYYWMSSLASSDSSKGRMLDFRKGFFTCPRDYSRYIGCTVRPVCPPQN